MRKRKPPQIKVGIFVEPLIGSGGWFADVYALCEFTSRENGFPYKFSVPLESNTAKKLTDLILNEKATSDFINAPSEQKRISKYIAETLGGIVARQPEWYRKRNYPLRYTRY